MTLVPLGNGWLPRIDRVLGELWPTNAPSAGSAREPLATFFDLLVTWNQRMDLTAARSADELVDLMLADAVVIAAQVFTSQRAPSRSERWLDVGSGAGAPGVALALLVPELSLTLVEPRQKRVAFLRTVLASLSLSSVVVERCRSSELDDHAAEIAVSRATLPPSEWLPEGARLAHEAVWVLLAREEAPTLDGWAADVDRQYRWPLTGVGRRAVRYVRRP